MKVLVAAQKARERFHRDAWLGYYGNGYRTDREGWRTMVRRTQELMTKWNINE